MSKTNIQIVKEYTEEVLNKKRFDRIFDYCSKDCVIHTPPYVGLGINADDRSDRVILLEIAPNAPAHEKLLPGDELVRVQDSDKVWETYDELKGSEWGQGIPGSQLSVTVRRGGKLISVPLSRERIDGWDLKLSRNVDVWDENVRRYWPDIKSEIQMIFSQDDLVASYCINSGTNMEYQRAAIWSEFDIYRIKDGLIVEMWGVEDSFAQMKQLGYRITEPEKRRA